MTAALPNATPATLRKNALRLVFFALKAVVEGTTLDDVVNALAEEYKRAVARREIFRETRMVTVQFE
jgi:hypothetical protein